MLGSRALALAFLLLIPSPLSAQWSPDFRVTNDPASSGTESDGGRNVVISQNILATVWSDTRNGNAEIYFRERVAGVWGGSERLTTNGAASIHPAIGRVPGDMRVVWQDSRSGHPEIWTKRKILGNWSADSCVTCDSFESARPSLDHTGEFLVWEETKDGNREIYVRRRLVSDGSWQPEFRISNDAAESSHPTVASPHPVVAPGIEPPLVIVAWQDERDGNQEIYSRLHSEFIPGWGDETRVSMNSASSRFPSVQVELAACTDVFTIDHWVAWQDDRYGNEEIYFAQGSFGTWISETRLTSSTTPSQHPSVSTSFQVTFGPFGSPLLCAGPNVVWEERASGSAGSIQFLDLTTNDPAIPITASGADAFHPSIASVHVSAGPGAIDQTYEVVWTDRRDSNEEIYLAEGMAAIDITGAPETPPGAADFRVSAARPNPFRATTEFSLQVDRDSDVTVRLVDAAGRSVRELFAGTKPVGRHQFTWDGRDAQGSAVAAGVYFAQVRVGSEEVARRIVLIR